MKQPLLPEPLRADEGYFNHSTHPVCEFLRAGRHVYVCSATLLHTCKWHARACKQ